MESVIIGVGVLALLAVAYKYWPKATNTLDVNQDGKIDAADAKAAVAVVEAKVEEAVKVEVAKVVEEAKAVEAKVEVAAKTEVKKVAKKAKAAVNKTATKVAEATAEPAPAKKGGRPKKSA